MSFVVVSGPASLGIDGKTLTLTGAGTVKVQALQVGNATFAPAPPITRSIVVAKASQSIAFTLAPAKIAFGAPVPTLTATASSGLPVEYTLVSGPGILANGGTALRPTGAGTIRIRADQFGDDDYASALPVERTLTVTGPVLVLGNLRQTYTATPRAISVDGVPEGFEDQLVVTYSAPRTYPRSETPPTDAGTYSVTATLGSLKKTGSLIIAKAPLRVLAEDATRPVAVANPSFTLSYDGFLGGDTPSDLDLLPLPTTSANLKSPAGAYPITFTGGLDNNYAYVPAPAPGTLTVVGFGGSYEALLVRGDFIPRLVPVGRLAFTVAPNALTYTGTLTLAAETTPVRIRGSIAIAEDLASATLTFNRATSALYPELDLALIIASDRSVVGSLDRNGAAFAFLDQGDRLYAPAPRSTAPWIGAHTLVLHAPTNLLPEGAIPAGSGHATAAINASGFLKLTGKLADGTPLTANLSPDASGLYRLYVNPYGKRLDSFLAGFLLLLPHPKPERYTTPRFYIPDSALVSYLSWQKAALPETTPVAKQDKAYRFGFGPLGFTVSLDPWIAPSAAVPARGANPAKPAVNLAQLLGLATAPNKSASISLAFGPPDDLDLGASTDLLPTLLTLSAKGAVSVAEPVTTPVNATNFSLKVTAATGIFTGAFTLSDTLPGAAKATQRKVHFAGTLRQAPFDSDEPLGHAHFLFDPVVGDTGPDSTEQISAEIRFEAPGE